jgi:hypothetical protein
MIGRISLAGNSVLDIQQAIDRLIAAISKQVDNVGIANVNFVGMDGDDGSAQPGSLTNKYRHVQAAVDAATPGTLVLAGPGIYQESVVIPPTTTRLIIAALAPDSVFIAAAATDEPAISFVPSVGGNALVLCNVGLAGDVDDPSLGVLNLDCSAITDGLPDAVLVNTKIGNGGTSAALRAVLVNEIRAENAKIDRATLFEQVGTYRFFGSELREITDNYDAAGIVPSLRPRSSEASVLYSTVGGAVLLTKEAKAAFQHCELQQTAELQGENVGADAGILSFRHSSVQGAVSFPCSYTGNPGDYYDGSLSDHSNFAGGFSASNANAGVHVRATGEQCIFNQGQPILAGSCAELNILKSVFGQGDLASAGVGPDEGTIDRDMVILLGQALAPGFQNIAVSPKLGNASYMAVVNNQISQGFPVTFSIAFSANTIQVTVEAVWNGVAYGPAANPTTADICLIAQRS